jgi:hypothetical protein
MQPDGIHARPFAEYPTFCGLSEAGLPSTILASDVTCSSCRIVVKRLLRARPQFIGPRRAPVAHLPCRFCVPRAVCDPEAAVFTCDRCGRDARAEGPPRIESMAGGEAFLVCIGCNRSPMCMAHRRALRTNTWFRRELTQYELRDVSDATRVVRKIGAMSYEGAPIIHARAGSHEPSICGSDGPWSNFADWITCAVCIEKLKGGRHGT